MYEIKKIVSENTELLPDIVDTPIWKDCDDFINPKCPKRVRVIATLYNAIKERENYYQWNTPTAFGDTQYKYYQGVVVGILCASELKENTMDDKIIISTLSNRKILIIDKVKRPQSYYDISVENKQLMRELGM